MREAGGLGKGGTRARAGRGLAAAGRKRASPPTDVRAAVRATGDADPGVSFARLWPYSEGMRTRPLAFSVHLLTASGAALALMALVAAGEGDWRLMFGWLGIALIVDGIDGPLARHVDTKRNAANWDGVILDLVIDYLTYVFIPAYRADLFGHRARRPGGRSRRSSSR